MLKGGAWLFKIFIKLSLIFILFKFFQRKYASIFLFHEAVLDLERRGKYQVGTAISLLK